MTPMRLICGFRSSRTDDDVVHEVMNALDEMDEEGDYDLISWRRSGGTRFLVQGPVEYRGIISTRELKLRAMPFTQLLDDLGNNRNEWLYPRTTKSRTSVEIAQELVQQWERDLWDIPKEDLEPNPPPQPETDPNPPNARRLRSVRVNAIDQIKSVLGEDADLSDPDDGVEFKFYSFQIDDD